MACVTSRKETERKRTERISPDMLLESVDIITEYLHEELREFEEGAEIPEDHVAFHVRRLAQWRNQPPEAANPTAYNGWRNYETWLANLWQTNDRDSYFYCQELARNVLSKYPVEEDGVFTQRQAAAVELAELLKEESQPEDPGYCSFFTDLLNGALAEIDWYEIATYFLDEATE